MKSLLLLLATVILFSIWDTTYARRAFTATDLVEMERVGPPVVSPDGSMYVFNVRTWDQVTNKVTTNLWLGEVEIGSSPFCINKQENITDYAYVWTSDGSSILFLSTRSGSSQLWGLSLNAGKPGTPYRISDFPVDISNLKISHDGKKIGFSAQVYPDLSMEQTAEKDNMLSKSRVNAQKWDHLFIRRWDVWWTGKYNHIFVSDLSFNSGSKQWTISHPTDVMLSFVGDCPSRPFGGSEEFDFSFDSKELAFTTQIGNDMAWSTDLNVYTVDLETLSTNCITCANVATDTQPAYSPDGKYLALLSMEIPQYESDRLRVRIYDRTTKQLSTITESWQRSPSFMKWASDSSKFYAIVGDEARSRIYSISIPEGIPTMIMSEHNNEGFDLLPCMDKPSNTCVIVSQSSSVRPADIFMTINSGAVKQLTFFNQDRLSEIDFSTPIEFHYYGANDDVIQGWVFKPYGYQEGQKYPLIMYIHGGPEGAWMDEFHYRWNPQTIAGGGFAVFAPNPHGSSTFGDAFCQSIQKDWGGKPFQDILIGLDAVANAFPWIDANNAGAMGASYGGYMINWINSQTEKFKCLICHDGVFDPLSEYYFTDELFFNEIEFGGIPYVDRTYYDKWSPLTYAGQMVTPQLTFHGGRDYRIPDVSGISAFTVLQRKGIESLLIRFPDEDHWVQDPNNSMYWHQQVLAWFNKWLNP